MGSAVLHVQDTRKLLDAFGISKFKLISRLRRLNSGFFMLTDMSRNRQVNDMHALYNEHRKRFHFF